MNPILLVLLLSLIPAALGALGFNVAARYSHPRADETAKLHRQA